MKIQDEFLIIYYSELGQNFILKPYEWKSHTRKVLGSSTLKEEESSSSSYNSCCTTSIINFSMLNVKYLHVYTFMVLKINDEK